MASTERIPFTVVNKEAVAVWFNPMPIISAISHKNEWGKRSSTEEEHLVGKEKIQVANTLTSSCNCGAAGRVLYALNLPQHISKSTCPHKNGSRPLNTDRTKKTRLEILM